MKNKAIVLSSLLLVSSAVLAEQPVIEAGKQTVKEAGTVVAPETVKGVEAAGQAVDSAKSVKESVEHAPVAVKEQAQEKVKQAAEEKIKQATPEELKKGAETLKAGKEAANKLKGKVDAAPKSADEAAGAVKAKAKQKAAEKALDLLR